MIRSVAVVFNWKSVTQPGISFWGLAAAAGTVALLGSIAGFAARLGWLFELTSQWTDRLAGLRTHYPQSLCEPREDNFGIAFLSRIALTRAQIVYLGEAEVPSVEAEFSLSGKGVLFLGTHTVPPASPFDFHLRNDQLRAVASRLGTWTGPALLLGDLNTTPYSPHLADLIQTSRLRDTSRGFLLQGTWPATVPPLRISARSLSGRARVPRVPSLRRPARRFGSSPLTHCAQPAAIG